MNHTICFFPLSWFCYTAFEHRSRKGNWDAKGKRQKCGIPFVTRHAGGKPDVMGPPGSNSALGQSWSWAECQGRLLDNLPVKSGKQLIGRSRKTSAVPASTIDPGRQVAEERVGASRRGGRAHGRLNNYAEEVRVCPDFDGKK